MCVRAIHVPVVHPFELHQQALASMPGMREIVLIGFFEPQLFAPFLADVAKEFPGVSVRYGRD